LSLVRIVNVLLFILYADTDIHDKAKNKENGLFLAGLAYAARDIYHMGMAERDPFEGLGKALARLREWRGFATQTEAAERLGFDQGQLSRWESENPRPTLENLGRLIVAYRVELSDLVALLEKDPRPRQKTPEDVATAAKMARFDELIREVTARHDALESRLKAIESRRVESTPSPPAG
jgi:transcriptional regulator with XRE-family HTH domain